MPVATMGTPAPAAGIIAIRSPPQVQGGLVSTPTAAAPVSCGVIGSDRDW